MKNAKLCVRSAIYSVAVLSVFMGLNAPATADNLSAAATAGEVANKQKLGQMFPQPPAAPQAVPPILQQFQVDPDETGFIGSYQPNGATVTTSNAFFQNLGTNGRTCFTCHEPQDGWGLSAGSAQNRFNKDPTDPLFRLVDGATCPSDDVSTPAAMQSAYALLLSKGLIRIGLPMQSAMEFQILNVQDPYGCNTNPVTGLTGAKSGFLSFYRRPLPSTNLGFLSAIMWDRREPDLFHQSVDATLGHAQATNPPSFRQQQQIVSFEGCTTALTPGPCANIASGEGLYTGQVIDTAAGNLYQDGPTGGPLTVYQELGNFVLCMNDPFGCNGQTFNPIVFSVYDTWANLTGSDPVTQARLALARGEQVFNSMPFKITGVAGLNDTLGKSSVNGTCSTCHDTPNVGNHSATLALNIGVTGASKSAPPALDISGLPVFTVLCTSGPSKTFEVTDLGVAMISGKCADIGKTKAPILRGLTGRSPYFHNGSAPNIEALIEFYNQRFNIGLTDQQKADLGVFLESL